jgi:hypothetical protein
MIKKIIVVSIFYYIVLHLILSCRDYQVSNWAVIPLSTISDEVASLVRKAVALPTYLDFIRFGYISKIQRTWGVYAQPEQISLTRILSVPKSIAIRWVRANEPSVDGAG